MCIGAGGFSGRGCFPGRRCFSGGGRVRFRLFPAHARPVYEAVNVVGEEHDEADDHGKVGKIFQRGEYPQYDEHHVVGGVGEGVQRAAAEGQIDGEETGRDRDRARHDVRRIEGVEDKAEGGGDRRGRREHQQDLFAFQPVHRHLCAVALVGVFQPGDERKDRHRHGHAEVGDHLSVVGKGVGDDAVEDAEHDGQRLPYGVALCVEDEGGRPDERGAQREIIGAVEQGKREGDEQDGRSPQRVFCRGEVGEEFFHTVPPNMKISTLRASSKT